MTNSNTTTTNNKTGIKQAASLVAMAVAPLAIVMGVAAMNVPSAEAGYTQCIRIGQIVQCNSYSFITEQLSGSLRSGIEAESYTRPDKGKAGGAVVAIDLPTEHSPRRKAGFFTAHPDRQCISGL